jgi:hypothetical protein
MLRKEVTVTSNKTQRSDSTDEAKVAEWVDPGSGVVQRVEFLATPRGRVYVWSGSPPESTEAVLICSPISADFTANYHRERQLALALVSRGISVIRFHYLGEGNSEGESKDLTFSSICEDASEVFERVTSKLAPTKLAVFGTRIGVLVACAVTRLHPVPIVALWEPVGSPDRFFEEGGRSRRLSNLLRSAEGGERSWREELAHDGVLDLLGFSVYAPLVSSLDEIDVASLCLQPGGKVMVVDFGCAKKQVATWLAQQDPATNIEVLKIGVAEPWWFQDDHMRRGTDKVVAATADWLSRAFEEIAS